MRDCSCCCSYFAVAATFCYCCCAIVADTATGACRYLEPRGPIAAAVNPFFVLEDDPTPSRNSQIARATSLIVSALSFMLAEATGELPPDEFRDTRLDMKQYPWLFKASRIPGADSRRVRAHTAELWAWRGCCC